MRTTVLPWTFLAESSLKKCWYPAGRWHGFQAVDPVALADPALADTAGELAAVFGLALEDPHAVATSAAAEARTTAADA
ncbi:hypothetical protein ADK64_18045 [Streptomyces sp. MMG1121]|nr:hypothetical protein ADK64_18045 [Streptomyces sp. MMG1121]